MRRHGFTLLELSIVLIVIGLIAGGIVAGTTMIKQAELQKFVGALTAVQTSFQTFQTKYRCLPGDCDNAVAQGLGGANGSGDRLITGNYASLAERDNTWTHLIAANMLGRGVAYTGWASLGSGSSHYGLPLGSVVKGIQPYAVGNVNFFEMGMFNTSDAFDIDRKIDDGLPGDSPDCSTTKYCGAGNVWSDAVNIYWQGRLTLNGYGANSCIDDTVSPQQYNLANPSNASFNMGGGPPCTIVIRLQDKL